MTMDQIVAYCNHYGYIFQGSEIYGGLANTWDYGPLGARLKNNIKDAWRRAFVETRDNSFELDAAILMNPMVWKASGHLDGFTDPLLDCKNCKARHRADSLIAGFDPAARPDAMTLPEMLAFLREKGVPCPRCGKRDFTDIRTFNLMFSTKRGVTEESADTVYLRPENAQGEYVNYLNLARVGRCAPPFGVGQVGKAFRNEITPGNFTFRTIEFEQMEYQMFVKPGTDGAYYEELKEYAMDFFVSLGLPREKLRFHDHEKLAHYAKAACDIEYLFPFGWGEINGTHNRGDFDLSRHQAFSGKSMEARDEATGEKYIPRIVESTCGADRLALALLCEGLAEDGERLLLRLAPRLAPVKVTVLPLNKNRHGARARALYEEMRRIIPASYDEAGNIGRRYRRGDAAGTPFAVTVDDETLEKNTVTLRDRDTMAQETIRADALPGRLRAAVSP